MLEHMAVQQVITRYCDGVTRRDWIIVADLFTSDATWDVDGENASLHFAGAGADVVPDR